ncbi:hypothetical protein HYC85_021758 [Camellia sinensis]|uniref:Inosine/uridine-preferring nucleoside hydrolase domain-containing protein n=1 Tax=Camellia sinensis TaxID=4442 RepID=A0A7J7GL08_CAMSI|nr:hypothetical protein HYC85_021758 [Camellia sinensis]
MKSGSGNGDSEVQRTMLELLNQLDGFEHHSLKLATYDSIAIFMAFQTPQLEVLGLTTIFGNVTTEDATRNALILGEIAGYPDAPVAEDSPEPLKGGTPDVAYFIHGSDGLGNTNLPPPKSKKIEKTASEFLVNMVSEYPGQVSILALGPLTNLALAVKKDSSFASKVKRVVILGGSFFALGNVNPAAEANVSAQLELRIWSDLHSLALIYGDPEAADIVFTSGANIVITGINITRQVIMTDADLDELRLSEGRHAQLLSTMCKFYRDWHVESLGVYGIFLHDPVSFVALVRPDLFTYKKGVVRVGTEGIYMGHTLLDHEQKWDSSNPWSGYAPVSVAWTAVKKDSSFASKVKRVVILGGSFFALGNVNPAAEANVSALLELRIWICPNLNYRGYPDAPVAEGSPEPLKAVKKDSSFASKVKRVVILGGSFFALGNVNPAAEANMEFKQSMDRLFPCFSCMDG